jgi:O-antigen ligase
MGTVMDAVLTLLVLGFFIQIKVKNEWHLFSKNISIVIFIWVIYNIIQVFNPAAESRLAWLYTIRTMAIVSISYFVFNFNIRTKNFIKTLFKWWILWSFINACYALKQEYIGFFYFEQSALDANPDMASRYFQGGHMRKFSMLSDPVTFAYNMVTAFFLCIALLNRQLKTFKKITLGFLSILFLYVMLFSGTRAAYLIVPVILVFYAFLTFNRKTLIFFGLASLGIGLLVYTPSSNANIIRFQSAFWPKYDASYLLREENQAKIKPYIYSHPFGGGLGSVGEWGARFSPNSYIGKFQPDSGYVRTTIELGWIGLIIFSVMVLMILITGIKNYYKIRDPELKSYFLACLLLIASWNVGNFAQQSIVQYPSNVLFFLAVALMGAIYRIDQQQNLAVDDKR